MREFTVTIMVNGQPVETTAWFRERSDGAWENVDPITLMP